MWDKCPKTRFCSYLSVQVALNLAVLQFNRGTISFVSIAERMKIQVGSHSIRYFREKDVFRIKEEMLFTMNLNSSNRGMEPFIFIFLL